MICKPISQPTEEGKKRCDFPVLPLRKEFTLLPTIVTLDQFQRSATVNTLNFNVDSMNNVAVSKAYQPLRQLDWNLTSSFFRSKFANCSYTLLEFHSPLRTHRRACSSHIVITADVYCKSS